MPDPQAFILVAAYMRVAATTIGGSPAWAAHDYRGGNVGFLQGKKPHRRSLLVLFHDLGGARQLPGCRRRRPDGLRPGVGQRTGHLNNRDDWTEGTKPSDY